MDKDLIQYLNFDNSWTRFCVQFEFNDVNRRNLATLAARGMR